MASEDVREILLRVPAELTVNCKGLALDMGGSVMKFVFRTKEDIEKASQNGEFGNLRLVSFDRTKLKQGLDYVRQHSYVTTDDSDEDGQPTSVFTTGIGCTEFNKLICQTLNIRMLNVTEFDCFIKSFNYLAERLPRSELLEPFFEDALVEPISIVESQLVTFAEHDAKNYTKSFGFDMSLEEKKALVLQCTGQHKATTQETPSTQPLSKAEPDMYPYLMVMCGSGFGYLQVNGDGSFRLIDISTRGGKGFTGLGCQLTNAESFDELIELASNGNYRNLHIYSNELCGDGTNSSEDEDSVYKTLMLNEKVKPMLIYCFGKGAFTKNKFSREDLAAAWLHWFVLDLVQSLTMVCRPLDIKRVFFSGGFCQNEFVRRYITQELVTRNLLMAMLEQHSGCVTFDFIKPGQHLGAIGCMLNGLEKFL